MSKPVAIGPQSRTVIGDVPSESDKVAKPNYLMRYGLPLGLIGIAFYITYKGKI